MFERFDERARLAVVVSQEEARRLNDREIDVEHLLLGVASGEPELVGVPFATLRNGVAAVRGFGEEPTPHQIPFTREAKRALERMVDVGASPSNALGSAELLLALLPDPDVERVLRDAGVDIESVRANAEGAARRRPSPLLQERLRGPGPVGVVVGGGAPIGDLGNRRTDARLLRAILVRGGEVADLLREHGIHEELLARYGAE
jgi:hypothetical protein